MNKFKKYIFLLALIILVLIIANLKVSAEDVIRYSEKYQISLGEITEIPDNNELKHWFSVDLPVDENNNDLYTVEFDTSKVDLTKEGVYEVSMIFYRTTDKKYEKKFELEVKDTKINIDTKEINSKYIERSIKIITIIILIIILILTLFDNTNYVKIAVIKNNKFLKIIKLKSDDDYDKKLIKIMKKLKLRNISNILLINKEDLTDTQMKQIKTRKKYKYALFIN